MGHNTRDVSALWGMINDVWIFKQYCFTISWVLTLDVEEETHTSCMYVYTYEYSSSTALQYLYNIHISDKSLSRFRSDFFVKNLWSDLHRNFKKKKLWGLDQVIFFLNVLSSDLHHNFWKHIIQGVYNGGNLNPWVPSLMKQNLNRTKITKCLQRDAVFTAWGPHVLITYLHTDTCICILYICIYMYIRYIYIYVSCNT